jgi:hypothetical protein
MPVYDIERPKIVQNPTERSCGQYIPRTNGSPHWQAHKVFIGQRGNFCLETAIRTERRVNEGNSVAIFYQLGGQIYHMARSAARCRLKNMSDSHHPRPMLA